MFKYSFAETPREFEINGYKIRELGELEVIPDSNSTVEFVTFKTASGRKIDVSAAQWGYYLGGSANSRLKNEGFKTGIMANEKNQLYVVAVEGDKISDFTSYLEKNRSKLLCWLDEWVPGTTPAPKNT